MGFEKLQGSGRGGSTVLIVRCKVGIYCLRVYELILELVEFI